MTGMGRHTTLVNGHRGEDGAATSPVIAPRLAPFAISPALDVQRLVPALPPPSPRDLPAAETGAPEADHAAPERRRNLRDYPWPLLVIAAPAAVAIWSGWVGLGGMCGFGPIHPLPGIADSFTINTAITLPIGVEAYGAYALAVWLGTKKISTRTRRWARSSAIGALALGCLGQVAFHLLSAARWVQAPWPVVTAVSCLPVVSLALAATLAHMIRADGSPEPPDDGQDEGVGEPSPTVTEEAPADIHEAFIEAVTDVPAKPSPPPSRQPSRQPSRRTSKQPSGLERATAVIASDGTLSNPEVAKRAKVSVSTVERARRAAAKGG